MKTIKIINTIIILITYSAAMAGIGFVIATIRNTSF